MKILFLTPYPTGSAPSQRFRFEQYFTFLLENGIEYDVQSFLDESAWQILYKPGFVADKILGVLRGFVRRIKMLFGVRNYTFVFIHREASPVGPPVIEWILIKIFRKRVIYDFDDAIWLPNTSDSNHIVARLKWHSKVASLCQWAYKVSCGNAYLCEYARQFNPTVTLNPTTIDTEGLHISPLTNKVHQSVAKDDLLPGSMNVNDCVIGWTGTHSTLPYLLPVLPVLQNIYNKKKFSLHIISNQPPPINYPFLTYIPWRKRSEIEDLQRFDIGLMPLTDDPWARGKCGFKALQYMALGIPAVASPVGVNAEIIDSGVNGFLCQTNEEWAKALEYLLEHSQIRKEIGKAGRRKVEAEYSIEANRSNFLSLFI